MLHILSFALLPALLIVAAISDFMTFRIPNWLTLLTALLFFPMALATALPFEAYTWHILAGALLFLVGFILWQFNLLGAGDVKLMAAAGLWFGMSHATSFVLDTALVGAAQVMCMGLWALFMLSTEISSEGGKLAGFWAKLRSKTPNVPYGVAIAIGGILTFRDTWWLNGLQ